MKMIEGSTYTKVLICFWFWICQGSEYTMILNMSALPRVLSIPEYAWLYLAEYTRICLNMPEYA